MAELSAVQEAALGQLFACCPDSLLSQLTAVTGAMTGARAWRVRELVEAEVMDRRRRDIAMDPVTPLFRPRADGLAGLEFPPAVLPRLWRAARRNEPELLPQLDRDDDLARMVADRLCLSAAVALRDQPEAVWPEGGDEGRRELAACLDLAGLARRASNHLEAWLGRPSPEEAAELKLLMRQAATVAPDGAVRVMEMMFARLTDGTLVMRLVKQASAAAGSEQFLAESEMGLFIDRIMDALAVRAARISAFDPAAGVSGLSGLRSDLGWCAEALTEADLSLSLKPDGRWGKAVRQARLKISLKLSELFAQAERATVKLLPVERTALVGRMTRPSPRLDAPIDEAQAEAVRVLLAVIAAVRGPAAVFGCEAERRQTAEALTGRLSAWADEALERLNGGEITDEALAGRCIGLAAELLVLVGARDAGRTVRRRLAVAGTPPTGSATTRTSPRAA